MQPSDAPASLAQALRDLREKGWAGVPIVITQAHIAKAFEVSTALVSSWENTRNPKTPPEYRLASYATFFSTSRSIGAEGGRLLAVDELTAQEQSRRDSILGDLLRLREAADVETEQSESRSGPISRIGRGPWYFPGEREITIACAPLPEALRGPYADPASPDHTALHAFGDVGSLLELYGHIRAVNPDTPVNVRDATDLKYEDLTNHLVLLGGVDWNESLVSIVALLEDLPIRQLPREGPFDTLDPGGFVVTDGSSTRELRPVTRVHDGKLILVEDVAQFIRGPNPYNRKRTVSICTGSFGRGTYGIVRALTDPKFRDRNAEYLKGRFDRAETFSLVSRVRVVGSTVLTPDWTQSEMRLHEWPGTSR